MKKSILFGFFCFLLFASSALAVPVKGRASKVSPKNSRKRQAKKKRRRHRRLKRKRKRIHLVRFNKKKGKAFLLRAKKSKTKLPFQPTLGLQESQMKKVLKRVAIRLAPRKDATDPVMTMPEVFQLVKKNNLDLRILRQRVVQAELIRARTWSMLKPRIQVQGSYTRNGDEVSFNPMGGLSSLFALLPEAMRKQVEKDQKDSKPTIMTPLNQLGLNVQVNWAFLNLRAIPLLQIAYMSVKQVGHTAKQARRELLFASARAYYGVLLSDGLIDISREQIQNATEHLRIAQARLRAGVVPALVVTKAELDLIRAKQSLIQSRNALRNTKLALALLSNRSTLRFRPQKPARPSLPTGGLKDWISQAKARRAEVKAAKVAYAIANKKISELWLQYAPTVALSGALRASNAGGFSGRKTNWSISLVAQLALYDGGSRHVALLDAYSKVRQARLEVMKWERKIDNELRGLYLSLQNSRASLKVAKQQVILARRSHVLTEERFKAGAATPVEVSDALAAYHSASVAILREKLNRDLTILNLRRATGNFLKR